MSQSSSEAAAAIWSGQIGRDPPLLPFPPSFPSREISIKTLAASVRKRETAVSSPPFLPSKVAEEIGEKEGKRERGKIKSENVRRGVGVEWGGGGLGLIVKVGHGLTR